MRIQLRQGSIVPVWLFSLSLASALSAPLTFAQEKPAIKPTSGKVTEVDANALMKFAHQSRYVWKNFPGFQANIEIETDGVVQHGTITVAPDLGYEVTLKEGNKPDWLESKLESVIGHRRINESGPVPVVSHHEAPRSDGTVLLASADGTSLFRLAEGRLAEVIRKSDSRWFEITNVDVLVADNGTYLPTFTTVSYRDPKTGDLTENRTNQFTWVEKGEYLLPERCVTVVTLNGGKRQTQRIRFREHVFLGKE